MTLDALFKKRQAAYLKNIMKYGRIIINDHFVLILFILFGAGGFAYSNYLDTISFGMVQPRILVAFLFFIIVSTGSLTLLLEPADTIFLLPKEEQFKRIFKKITRQSFIQSLLSVALTTVLTFPIFVTTLDAPITDLIFIFLTLAGLKWLNTLTKVAPYFEIAQKQITRYRITNTVIKLIAIISLTFIHIQLTTLVVIALAIYTGFLFFEEKLFFEHLFEWETMIQAEENRMQRLYRFIGMFTNVPNIQTNIKRLPWMDPALDWLSKRNPQAPYYYVLRTTTRNTDYSMLVIRATVVGAILLAVTSSFTMATALTLLFLYIIGFQLITLVHEIERTPQFQIYPVTQKEKEQAVFKLIFQLLILITIILALASLSNLGIYGLILLPIGFLFAYIFSYIYAPSRLKA